MNDLKIVRHYETSFENDDELDDIMNKLWNIFAKNINDPSGYFFPRENTDIDSFSQGHREGDISFIKRALLANDYYVCNRFEKYYVYAFAINRTRFYVWSKDFDAKIISWPKKRIGESKYSYEETDDEDENEILGKLVNNYDEEYDVNPVIKMFRGSSF